MKFSSTFVTILAAVSSTSAFPTLFKREVPQEHSHDIIVNAANKILSQNSNTLPSAIFGVLGNKAAQNAINSSKTKFTDPNCLQQNIADQVITNCKSGKTGGLSKPNCIAAGLKYRVLERNSAGIGVESPLCTSTPVNPELKGMKQHQDPAGKTAKQTNKQIEINLAKSLVAAGLSKNQAVQGALETATFAPGALNDFTAIGNSCDLGAGFIADFIGKNKDFGGPVIAKNVVLIRLLGLRLRRGM
ncbi:hypothetical protein HK098_006284 [Nowakowskiella sp. JEL0407]|nr:hypothetical protein HK098_006284 [Nowakowskiella sp. JEL0407]